MSELENFLKRWLRRKREAAEVGVPEAVAETPRNEQVEDEQQATPPVPQDDGAVADESGFDPVNLPSVDSIDADTDIRDFLRPDVPPELTRAALRRAWSSDPLIRDYIGPVENGWDFNDPNAVPGFGAIKAEEIPQLLARIFEAPVGEKSEPSVPEEPVIRQNLPSPRTPSSAAATPEVAGPEFHPDAEQSPRGTNVAQQAEPDGQTSPLPQRTPNKRMADS